MDKNQVANLLEEVATLLELKEGSNAFEVRAYQNAARSVSALEGDIEELTRAGKLKGTPGLGSTMIKRVEELVSTGKLAFYDELVKETPAVKLEMLRIPGVGPKKINAIYKQLQVNSLDELVKACQEHKVATLPGFGTKTEDKILQG
ncbi:MAG: helix-hairpin-helix domain-containing protein, partial [Ktedonobacteraceae bacterium]